MKPRWLEALINVSRGDSCGCATGAIFLGVALLVTGAWHAWHWQEARLTPWGTAAQILGLSIGTAIIGKIVGILLYQQHTRRQKRRKPQMF